MGKRFLTTITLPTLSSPPSSPSIGDIYFDTTQGKIGVYTASGWVYLSAGSGSGVDLTDYTRKSANEIITGNWTFSSTTTFSATPTFSAGLTISGGVGTWTTSGWTKAIDLLKGQALVWRTGDGLAIGLGVNSSSNTLYLSSSTADNDSATVSYPIVFDVENGRIGIGTTNPSEKIEVSGGNVKAVQLQSTASTGTAPLVVNSTTLVTNLNADLLDGYHASTNATANTVAARDGSGNLSANAFVSTVSTGTAPLQVSSTTKVTNLNADLLDGYDSSVSATANTVAVRDSNGYLVASGLLGSNHSNLLINAKNFGMELRIDEDNLGGDSFRITKSLNGSTRLLTVENSGNLNIGGFDLSLGTSDQSSRGNTGSSRALVKDNNATLAINYAGDFTGGTRIDGPGLGIGGTNYVYNTTTSSQIPGADANAKWLIVKDTTSGAGVISFNNTKDANGNILGSLVWTREGGQPDAHRQVAGIVAVQSGTGGTAGSELRFYAKGTSGPVQAMVVSVNGASSTRVGIGIASPTVALDVSGDVRVSGTITGTLNGNASTATRLQTARNISLGGSLSGSALFDGSNNVTINASINAGAVGTTQLANDAVTTPKIANESITYAKLAQDVRDAIAASGGGGGGGGGTRIFQTTIGDGTNSTYTVTHNFNTTNVEVSLTLLSTNEKIGAKVEVLNSNQIRVSFIAPIASNSVRVLVIG